MVLLSGNLGYLPTVAAAEFFADHVWPGVVRRIPGVRWVLAGARPHRRIRRLARRPGIDLHADVDDMGAYLARASVAIAPMATGSGVAMKVLEAWAAGVPVIAHPQVAAGLETAGGTAGVAVAQNADDWLRGVTQLLTETETAVALAERGHAIWSANYSRERVRQAIRDAVVMTRVPAKTS